MWGCGADLWVIGIVIRKHILLNGLLERGMVMILCEVSYGGVNIVARIFEIG